MSGFDLSDYVAVNERIEKFWKDHPTGRLVSRIHTLTPELVVVAAEVYLTSDLDAPPTATGHSMLKIPGTTGFTKGSEVENAETSAWGRALAAAGYEVKRGIASREEVANKADEPVGSTPPPVSVAPRGRTPHVASKPAANQTGDGWEGF